MRKYFIFVAVSLSLFGCGGHDAPDFDGVWTGSYTSLANGCPFAVAQDINPLFPMTVSTDSNGVFTVVAVDGSTATGGQGTGEVISFLATSSKFGNYGSIAPYTCSSTLSTVGFLDAGTDKAHVTLSIQFTDCNTPGSTDDSTTCGVTYYGDADRAS